MQKLASIIKSLEDIGLDKSATSLQSIQKLYKIAVADFSKELEILQQLYNITSYLQDKSLDFIVTERLSFPPYSIETDKKYIIYSGDDLTNYSKQEILGVGFSNFLSNFIDKYMINRLNTLSGTDARKYEKAIEELTTLSSQVKSAYKKISRAPTIRELEKRQPKKLTRQDVAGDLRSLASTFTGLNRFITQVKRKYVPALSSKLGYLYSDEGRFTKDLAFEEAPETQIPDQETLEDLKERSEKGLRYKPKKKKEIPVEEYQPIEDEDDITTSSVKTVTASTQLLEQLSNLRYDFDSIRDRVDQEYAEMLGMSIEKFRELTRIDMLLKLEKTSSEEKTPDLLEEFISETEEYETGKEILYRQEGRKVAQDIITGKIGSGKKEADTIYSPEKVINAWNYLQGELEIKYEALVRNIASYFLIKNELIEEDAPLTDSKKQLLSNSADRKILGELANIAGVLR